MAPKKETSGLNFAAYGDKRSKAFRAIVTVSSLIIFLSLIFLGRSLAPAISQAFFFSVPLLYVIFACVGTVFAIVFLYNLYFLIPIRVKDKAQIQNHIITDRSLIIAGVPRGIRQVEISLENIVEVRKSRMHRFLRVLADIPKAMWWAYTPSGTVPSVMLKFKRPVVVQRDHGFNFPSRFRRPNRPLKMKKLYIAVADRDEFIKVLRGKCSLPTNQQS